MENQNIDEGLIGNEKIEQAIAGLQAEPSEEMLAHTLTVIRRRMRENGELILAVDSPAAAQSLQIQTVKTDDGALWWAAFTSFDEELKGADAVKSTFLTDMEKLFTSALTVQEIQGVILNPWNRTIMLNKSLLTLILGRMNG